MLSDCKVVIVATFLFKLLKSERPSKKNGRKLTRFWKKTDKGSRRGIIGSRLNSTLTLTGKPTFCCLMIFAHQGQLQIKLTDTQP